MGLGFRLTLKWGFPARSHSLTNSCSSLSSSSYVRGKETSFNSTRQSFLSVISGESEAFYKDPLKAYTSSTGASQFIENNSLETEDMKMFVKRDHCTSSTNLKVHRAAHFNLLIENLHVLEDTFADSDVLEMERDILQQLGRLGAISLFNTCLSKTHNVSNVLDLSDVITEQTEEQKMKSRVDDHMGKVIVRSGKMKERKSRRGRTLENATEVSSLSMPLKTAGKDYGKPTSSSLKKKASKSKSRRIKIARHEAEMSRGVKLVAELETIRRALEEDTGQVASLSCWAEAAGLDEKVLQQHLHYGWSCRDELIRSTRSLVLYIARDYRGQGIALEDLLQAGNLGILQGAERFDHTRGYRFSTYVQYWIRKSMSRMVAQYARGIRVPFALSSAISKIHKARKALHISHRKYPDDYEIAKHTGLSLAKIRSASKCFRVVASTDQKIGEDINVPYREILPDMSVSSPEEVVMEQHKKENIRNLLNSLDSIEKQVLYLRYGLEDYQPKSLQETGRVLRVTKEWIRRVEKKAMTKLMKEDIRRNLSHFLDTH